MCNISSRLHRWNRSQYPDGPQPRQLSTVTTKIREKKWIKHLNTKNMFYFASGTTKKYSEKRKHIIRFVRYFFFIQTLFDLVSFNYMLYNVKIFPLFLLPSTWKLGKQAALTFFSSFATIKMNTHWFERNHANFTYWDFDEWNYVLYQSINIARVVFFLSLSVVLASQEWIKLHLLFFRVDAFKALKLPFF